MNLYEFFHVIRKKSIYSVFFSRSLKYPADLVNINHLIRKSTIVGVEND